MRRAALALLLAAPAAFAAGGHHAVDDAAILDSGQCEVEAWAMRSRESRLVHVGPNCGVGPIEVGLALDRERADGQWGTRALQVKGAWQLNEAWSAGAALVAFRQPGQVQGRTLLAMATWSRGSINVHLNAGRDFVRGAGTQGRGGAAIEWSATPQWQALLERYREQQAHFVRAGLRWQPTPSWNLDFSRAQALHRPQASTWILGTAWQLGSR